MSPKNASRVEFRAVALAAAVAAVLPLAALGDATNDAGFTGPGVEHVVSTSGATALGAFTRARNSDNTYNRGPLSLGVDNTRIGRTTYTFGSGGIGQFTGIANTGAIQSNDPTLNNDRFVYKYHETGSIAGILELVDSNGLLVVGGVQQPAKRPSDPNTANPLYINGNRFVDRNTGPFGGYSTGANYDDSGAPLGIQNGQEFARIAYSDVRTEQAFAVSGAANVNARPTQAGYGLGRGDIGNTNFQRLRNAGNVAGGVDPATTRLRNEALAVVPFNLVANPGTGLARLTKNEGAWLQATGRLPNGANFNVPTRDSGSGTRNQGGNNLGIDPTWGSGERDRVALASYTTTDPDGNTITVNPGDEADPRRSLTGSTTADLNESRVSPTMRFADKTSGSTGIRTSTQAGRMSAGGILSSGDTGAFGRSATTNSPVRALAVDWGNGHGFVQAKAQDVTEGRYEMWSASQAVTVTPVGHTVAMDTNAANGRPISGDANDEASLPGGGSNLGVHRKFLDNITTSVATLSAEPTNQTPADAVINAGFIPGQIMGVTKQFDGDPQISRTRSTVDPDGAGPQLSEQALWNAVAGSDGALANSLNWQNGSTHNGNVAGGGVRYNLYAPTNTLSSSDSNADVSIRVNGRTNLAGDMNNDGVRDIGDVAGFARAYASPDSFLALNGSATPSGSSTVNDGSSLNATVVSARSGGLLGAAPTAGHAGLVVLTDLNSDGNVVPNGAGDFTVNTVDRADVRYFLYGAAIDTSAQAGAVAKREDGVRLGQLKKNTAILRFNNELNALVGNIAGFNQGQADGLKFNRFDVNNDGVVNRADAQYVDRNIGKNFTSLTDVLGTNDDLVSAELNDDNAITHVDPNAALAFDGTEATLGNDSDFQQIRAALGTFLLDGDTTLDGIVDGVDLGALAANWQTSVDRWSLGDFNFDGFVDGIDLGSLASNWQVTAAGISFEEAVLAYPELAAAVPEPSSLGGLIGLAVLGLRRRRRTANHA